VPQYVYVRIRGLARDVRVHLEFPAYRDAGAVVTLAKHPREAPILAREAAPHHHEVAIRIRGHCGVVLRIHGVRVDLELATDGKPRAIISKRPMIPT
jgi:hypothetical protein